MSQNYTGRVLFILAVLVVALVGFPGCGDAFHGIFTFSKLFDGSKPWSEKHNLKPGIDIAGGTKLLYEIKVPPTGYNTTAGSLAEQVEKALKQRVDPDGLKNLIWRPQGDTRLEIQLPRSGKSGESAQIKQAFTAAQEELEATNIRPAEVFNAIEKKTGAERQKRLDQLAGGSPQRQKLFADLVSQYDQQVAARKKIDEANKAKDTKAAAEAALAGSQARTRYNELKSQINDTNLSISEFQIALDTPDANARQQKLDDLYKKVADFPARKAAMDKFQTAYANFKGLKGAIDDASDLKRLLRGSGVLEFHILVNNPAAERPDMLTRLNTKGPAPQAGDDTRWYLVDNPQFGHQTFTWKANGKQYVLAWTTPEQSMVHRPGAAQWSLQNARPFTVPDKVGQVVEFTFDSTGGALFSQLTGNNTKQPMAIVLDDKVISAPTIKEQIGQTGTIDGGDKGFNKSELNYLVNTLRAGSLPAQLGDDPVSEQTITPTFGQANLDAALFACKVGLIVVGIFLIGYYYLAGLVAYVAVLMNLVIILGVLAMFNATFTLPAIAGIVLTVGTAIDANVLIFERLREEQHRGLSITMAMRNAFERARSAIIDSNATTVITSLVLYLIGSEEVKGFGLTLLIGIFSSLFTALFVTKTILGVLVERYGVKDLRSLPQTFPRWDRLLKPNINWMGMVWPFVAFSVLFIGVGLSAFVVKQTEMYDVEFTKGTEVQFKLNKDIPLEKVQKIIADADDKTHALPSVGVVGINGKQDEYEVVTPNDNARQVREALFEAFKGSIETELPSTFDNAGELLEDAMRGGAAAKAASPTASAGATLPGVEAGGAGAGPATLPALPGDVTDVSAGATVLPIEKDTLTIDGIDVDATANPGGVAVVLRNLNPPLKPSEIKDRINRATLQAGSQQKARRVDVVPLVADPSSWADKPTAVAVVMVSDPSFPYAKNPEQWKDELARPVWKLINDGVTTGGSLGKVSNFDAQVAAGVRLRAMFAMIASIVLIMVYIWFRFGDLKYGTATVVALLHDTFAVVGAIGLSHYVAGNALGHGLMLEPFRINLTLVAAILTVMGYSMIDTIVVFDRIRENRGKYGTVTRQVINDSVNQTLSRTLLTAGTTLIMVAVMYICGGPGIHGFTFVLLVGILFGTYSSIAIAAPILLLGKQKVGRTQAASVTESAGGRKALPTPNRVAGLKGTQRAN